MAREAAVASQRTTRTSGTSSHKEKQTLQETRLHVCSTEKRLGMLVLKWGVEQRVHDSSGFSLLLWGTWYVR